MRSVPRPWTGADRTTTAATTAAMTAATTTAGGGGGDFFGKTKKMLSAPNKNIGATIRIGQESWCLPYAVFFLATSPSLIQIYTS